MHGVGYGYDPCLFSLAPGELRRAPEVSQVEVVCSDEDLDRLLEAILAATHTGCRGDGIVFVTSVERTIRIRTREEGAQAFANP